MSHPFGDLISQHLHRKHGLSYSKLAEGILQDPAVVTRMCKGERLGGGQARERVLAMIDWLYCEGTLDNAAEADALLSAARMEPLRRSVPAERALLQALHAAPQALHRNGNTPTLLPASPLTPQTPPTLKRKTNLPAPLTSFFGRSAEMAAVSELLRTRRLVTLTGAGGVGKTRLATEIGIHLVQESDPSLFADGIWFVALASLHEGALIAQTIARQFKLMDTGAASPLEGLQNYLADKQLLLILDNCEHLADASAELAAELLHHCWQLHVLVTSREELRVPGEAVFAVPPLALPDSAVRRPEDVQQAAAAQLFLDRLHSIAPALPLQGQDFTAVAEICRLLDGIPLALELAAPLARSLTLQQVVDQLHDQMAVLTNNYRIAVPRHKTMAAALDWGYRLLEPAEQQLLMQASVFAGGWTEEAAQAVCLIEPQVSIGMLLHQLVAKSFVLVEVHTEAHKVQRRYRMLEPVRQFAAARLAEAGAYEATTKLHAFYYFSLAEQMGAARDTHHELAWQQRMLPENDNIRALGKWALDHNAAMMAHCLCNDVFAFWGYCGSTTETMAYIEAALALKEPVATLMSMAAEADALNIAGYGRYNQRRLTEAREAFDRQYALRLEVGDPRGIVVGLFGINFILEDLDTMQKNSEQALAISMAVNYKWGEAWARGDFAHNAFARGDYVAAEALMRDAIDRFLDQGITFGAYNVMLAFGEMKRRCGELAQALESYRQALRVQQQMGYVLHTDIIMEGIAAIAAEEGEGERAVQLFGAAEVLRRAMGMYRWPDRDAWYAQDIQRTREMLDTAAWQTAWDAGAKLSMEQAVKLALEDHED